MATLKLKQVVKEFGDTQVIQGVNLDIEDREFVVFVGPSGCGKSTLLRMIAGLESVSSGDILINDQRMNDVGPAERGLAMVFQSYALYPHMTVEDNMGFSLRLAKVPKEQRHQKVLEAARILQLEPLLDRKPKALSGGQRQRVAIARALILEPKILLLDEPTSALDVSIQAEVLNLLQRIKRERGLTYILVSHNLAVVAHMCARLAVMNHGAIVEEMTVAQLRAQAPAHGYTRQLLTASLGYDRAAVRRFEDFAETA